MSDYAKPIVGRVCLNTTASNTSPWFTAPDPKPFACPICHGRGTVSPGFYSGGVATSLARESCRSCGGNGIVWRNV